MAVLPFANMSGDHEQEYFSDGITDDLITGLSRLPGLFVTARNSTFTCRGACGGGQGHAPRSAQP
jgi:adenylate cyclase